MRTDGIWGDPDWFRVACAHAFQAEVARIRAWVQRTKTPGLGFSGNTNFVLFLQSQGPCGLFVTRRISALATEAELEAIRLELKAELVRKAIKPVPKLWWP